MMMTMLKAGGVEPTSEATERRGYEDPRSARTGDRDPHEPLRWLLGEDGRAVKLLRLNPHILPPELEYRIIFMARDFMEQARSAVKLAELDMEPLPNRDEMVEEAVRNGINQTEVIALQLRQAKIPHALITYEAVLDDPKQASEAVAGFVGLDLDTAAMAAVVARDRDASCYDGLHSSDVIGHDFVGRER